MTHFASRRGDARPQNMHDITSDFTCLKVSALGKASQISGAITNVTIGPDSTSITENGSYNENVENEPDNRIVKDVKASPRPVVSKVSTRSGIAFSKKKILLENELQRKEEVQLAMQRRLRRWEEQDIVLQKQMALLRGTLQKGREEAEKIKAEKLARLEAEEEHLAQQTEIQRKHQLQLNAQRIRERQERLRREAEEQRLKKEKRALIERMLPLQASFRTAYQDISSISKSCKDKNNAGLAFAPHSARLKELSRCMEGLVEQAKMGNLTEALPSTAEVLVQHSQDILKAFRDEIARINASYDAEIARREEDLRRVQPQDQHIAQNNAEAQEPQLPHASVDGQQRPVEHQQVELNSLKQNNVAQVPEAQLQQASSTVATLPEASAGTESVAGGLLEFVDKDSLQLYVDSQQLLENHKTLCSSLSNSDAMKKFRFECQKAINTPVNAISGVSGVHLLDKFQKLNSLLAGKPPTNANQHQEGIAFCKYLLAKKFVEQGEALVSSKPEMAFSVAAVAIALWKEYPDFGELLLAYFRKTCPYLVPIFLPQQQGQSNDDYYKSLGYKYSEDGVVEGQLKFLKRMSGLMRLYAALTITKQRNNVSSPHPHGLQNAWRWLAAVLNIEPRPDVCATLILDMLEVAGHSLWATYPNQFRKLLTLLASQYYPRMQSIGGTIGGPMMRLEHFLKNSLTKGSIPPPEGQLPANFW